MVELGMELFAVAGWDMFALPANVLALRISCITSGSPRPDGTQAIQVGMTLKQLDALIADLQTARAAVAARTD